MSHLTRPRIHFKGRFSANVTTANNDDVLDIIDVEKATIYPRDGMKDDQFRGWAAEFDPQIVIDRNEKRIRAGRNYYGNGDCKLEGVTITGWQLPGDPLFTGRNSKANPPKAESGSLDLASTIVSQNSQPDPLLEAKVSFNKAIMIDVDPESIFSSQIFCDRFEIKSKAGQILFSGCPSPFYSCWHHSWRNLAFPRHFTGASAVWYGVIPTEKLCFDEAPDSLALQTLHRAATTGQGVYIRFCTYFFKYKYTEEDLAEKFKGGLPEPNPAYGYVVGSMGVWREGEMAALMASGRFLVDVNTLPYDNGLTFSLGPALAHEAQEGQRRYVALDLISTFPEHDENRAKAPLGKFSLQLRSRQGGREQLQKLGEVAYDRKTYEQGGGIVELAVPAKVEEKDLAEGTLELFAEKVGYPALKETDLTIAVHPLGFYLDEGREPQKLELQVLRRGQPAQEPIQVKCEQYLMTNIHREDKKAILPVKKALLEEWIVGITSNQIQDDSIIVEPGGLCQVILTSKKPGTCIIRFVDAQRPASDFVKKYTSASFINLRVFPADSYELILDDQLSFSFIYQEVLRYFYILYSPHPPFSMKDENMMRQCAEEVREHLEKEICEVDYMPRTRDLSAGKRQLLLRWCEKVIREHETSKIYLNSTLYNF